MDEQLTCLAWSILNDANEQVVGDFKDESRLHTDSVRLAALNMTLNYRFGKDYLRLDDDQMLFLSLSYESKRSGVNERDAEELAKFIIERLDAKKWNEIQRIALEDFVDLLERIHMLGSYHLPLSLQQASLQKPLGAFYTPTDIADYIVRLTLEPRLGQYLQRIRKEGNAAFEELLSLLTVDPACGTGVFLISALKILQRTIKEGCRILENLGVPKHNIEEYGRTSPLLYGVDMDGGALEVADVSLRILESIGTDGLRSSRCGSTMKKGNSLISLRGISGKSDNRRFFYDVSTRTPFEWREAFESVFNKEPSGFDFVVMNPPYERLRPNFAEFVRERLLHGEREIHENAFEEYKSQIRENTRYFRESNEFKLTNSYSLNTYQLFIERALQIAKPNGNIGCIVPSNLLSDISTQALRQGLLLGNTVNTIDDFPEASRLFSGVTQSVSILTLTTGGQTASFGIGLDRTSVEEASKQRRLRIGLEQIEHLMGPSLVIPRVDASGLALLEIMHKYPPLSSLDWIQAKRGELDLTLNKKFISSDTSESVLIRGSHINRFSLFERKLPSEFVRLAQFRKALNGSERLNHINVNRIACQQISNMGQRWRLKFAPIKPLMVLSNSCNYLVVNHHNSARLLDFLLGILNSELLNWRFQVSNSNNHVSISELQRLPIVQPLPRQRQLVDTIVSEVQRIATGATEDSSLIDACTFILYGFGEKDVKRILRLRKTPEDESTAIILSFSKMKGERLSR